jgi:uncharacterized protein
MSDTLEKVFKYMKERQLGEATGHDWWHSLRVYKMAVKLMVAVDEPVDGQVIEFAAILHDIDDWKLNGGDEDAGPRAAGELLSGFGVDEKVVSHVMMIIRDLSYKGTEKKSNMSTLEGMVVQDADRLDAVGSVGIARTFAYGGAMGNEIFNPEIPARISIDKEEYMNKTKKSTTINHFYEKLLNLKRLYNTPMAQEIGNVRHSDMMEFLEKFLQESDAKDTKFYGDLKKY